MMRIEVAGDSLCQSFLKTYPQRGMLSIIRVYNLFGSSAVSLLSNSLT